MKRQDADDRFWEPRLHCQRGAKEGLLGGGLPSRTLGELGIYTSNSIVSKRRECEEEKQRETWVERELGESLYFGSYSGSWSQQNTYYVQNFPFVLLGSDNDSIFLLSAVSELAGVCHHLLD